MPSRKLRFKNAQGEMLAAHLDLPPNGTPVAYALFAHCFTCSKDAKGAYHISHALTQAGVAVLRVDFTGLGESEGKLSGLSSNARDLMAAAEFLQSEYEAPQIVIGHSLGGVAALLAANRLEPVRAVVTVGAPADPTHVRHLLKDGEAAIREVGRAKVSIGGRPFTLDRQFLEELEEVQLPEIAAHLRRALLIMHAPTDNIVGIDNAAELYRMAKHPKSFISLDNADHLLTRAADARYAGMMIAAWTQRYFDIQHEPSWWHDVHDNQVAARTEGGLRTELMAEGFGLVADEPESVGGTETGPTPYDYLAAALAACTSMTLRLYADRKGWPLKAAEVRVQHSKVHVEDCLNCEEGGARLDHFERELELFGKLDATQRERLLEIASRCPVHRTLESEVRISTDLKS